MSRQEDLKLYTLDELLDAVATRYNRTLELIHTTDLVHELTKREGVDVTLVDDSEDVRLRVHGPAVILTIFD